MQLPLERLGLNEELVQLDYRASLGFAHAYLREADAGPLVIGRSELLITAASSFRQAGADAMLLGNAPEMRGAFRDASRIYAQLGSPYTALMEALADVKETNLPDSREIPVDRRSLKYFGLRDQEAEIIYLLLRGDSKVELTESLLNPRPAATLGMLDLPLSDYLQLISALEWNSQRQLIESLSRFVAAYDEAVHLASSRTVPWRLLVQRIHPAEPDVIGVLVMVQLRLRNDRLAQALREIEMSEMCRILLFGCLDTRFENTEFETFRR
jgi:hypothetical protein